MNIYAMINSIHLRTTILHLILPSWSLVQIETEKY